MYMMHVAITEDNILREIIEPDIVRQRGHPNTTTSTPGTPKERDPAIKNNGFLDESDLHPVYEVLILSQNDQFISKGFAHDSFSSPPSCWRQRYLLYPRTTKEQWGLVD
jgi:hypothetical protein